MILEALIDQFKRGFAREKRAQVCLWFDEKREFGRLLALLQAKLGETAKPPFILLAYDAAALHGEIWLKGRIHEELASRQGADRAKARFVVYLPFPDDRLENPGEDGTPALELLAEYKVRGLVWRLGGKRPTLFSFLKTAGLFLPESPSEQRRLYEGGKDSLLAKFISRHIEEPAEFWSRVITAQIAQAGILGDLEGHILDLAAAPAETAARLKKDGLKAEFLAAVRDRFGYDQPLDDPEDWVKGLVAHVALNEAFLGFGEPDDFPFLDRLPPATSRQANLHFLKRWLRDAERRPAWDRLVTEVESDVDLSGWATAKDGMAFGLPHLAQKKWEAVFAQFETASDKASELRDFFERCRGVIVSYAEVSRTAFAPAGHWELLAELGKLIEACDSGKAAVAGCSGAPDLVKLYVDRAADIERRYLAILRETADAELPKVARVASRVYSEYARPLNQAFFEALKATDGKAIKGLKPISEIAQAAVWSAQGKRAVVIGDALRYDVALAVRDGLKGLKVDLVPARAALPTITPIGMTALLPLAGSEVGLEATDGALRPQVQGRDMSVREERLKVLKAFGADCREVVDLERAESPPADLGELLVVFGHLDIDELGHGGADFLVRHLEREVDRLVRIIKRLHHWGYPEVHLLTDHGFIVADEDTLPPEVPCKKEWCLQVKERYAIVAAGADVPLVTVTADWNPDLRIAFPPGMAFFKAKKGCSHGGATLQEMVIPHLRSRAAAAGIKRIGVEVVLPAFELQRPVVKVVLRPVTGGKGAGGKQLGFSGVFSGRTLTVDVLRQSADQQPESILPNAKAKEVRLEPDVPEESVTLFFRSALKFDQGETLLLDIRDAETAEQFPPGGGPKLTMARDM